MDELQNNRVRYKFTKLRHSDALVSLNQEAIRTGNVLQEPESADENEDLKQPISKVSKKEKTKKTQVIYYYIL